jgi:hypothetical protein
VASPPLLWDTSNNPAIGVTLFPNVNFYGGDWVDNRYFVINGGNLPEGCKGPPHDPETCDFVSGVGVVDTQHSNPALYQGDALITDIPGASSDVDVDADGNLITGIGFGTSTRELKIWSSSEWDPANPPATALQYTVSSKTVLAGGSGGPLSGAYLGSEADGNLHVGGGAAVNTGNANEWKELQPDPCGNDSATGILYGSWSEGLAVLWNPLSTAGSCAAGDEWHPGALPRLTIYYPSGPADTDGDGIPDGSDNAYLTPNSGQED